MSGRLEAEVKNIKARLKRIEDMLQFSPAVVSFDWKEFSDLDVKILKKLLEKKRYGETTTNLAAELDINEPESSGRVVIWRRLRRIERISRKIKGFSLVVYESKRWSLNYQEFEFIVKKNDEDEQENA